LYYAKKLLRTEEAFSNINYLIDYASLGRDGLLAASHVSLRNMPASVTVIL